MHSCVNWNVLMQVSCRKEISELQLDNAKLHILDGTNWFYSKWLLNESDTENKYLVYAPFPKPSDAENPLADMYYY